MSDPSGHLESIYNHSKPSEILLICYKQTKFIKSKTDLIFLSSTCIKRFVKIFLTCSLSSGRLSKFIKSRSDLIVMKDFSGGSVFFKYISTQLISVKKSCSRMANGPPNSGWPRRRSGFLLSNFLKKHGMEQSYLAFPQDVRGSDWQVVCSRHWNASW